MSFSYKLIVPLCAAGAWVVLAQSAPQKSKLSPRELFYSAAPSGDKGTPKGSKGQSSKGTTGQDAKGSKDTASTKKGGADGHDHGGTSLPGGGQIVNASTAVPSGVPIGVSYILQKKSGEGMMDVSPDNVFHAGDLIQFVVQTNYPGYLYIANKGPSGSWTPLFPTAEIANGNNHVDAFHKYTVPPNYRIKFDEKTGTEEMFILFSREPVDDFEKLLYTDKGGSPAPARAVADAKPKAKPLTVAKADIPESTVERLRTAFSRDLIIEKIDDDQPGKKEKAVYIVNPTGNADSRVWADLRLVHK